MPKLQRQVDELGKRRIQQMRHNAEKIGETASGLVDIVVDATSFWERTPVSDQLSTVCSIRF